MYDEEQCFWMKYPFQAGHSVRVASPREEPKESKESQKVKALQHAGSSGHTVKEGKRQEEWEEQRLSC